MVVKQICCWPAAALCWLLGALPCQAGEEQAAGRLCQAHLFRRAAKAEGPIPGLLPNQDTDLALLEWPAGGHVQPL